MTIVNRPLPPITQDVNFEVRLPGGLPLITQEIGFRFTKETFHVQRSRVEEKAAAFKDIQSDEDEQLESCPAVGFNSTGNEPILIVKPPGEPGRPNSGGFGLEQALGWPSKEVKALSDWVGRRAEEKLDTSQGFSGQDPVAIDDICERAMARFSVLRQYESCWPVRSVLKLKLKTTSEKARKGGTGTPGRRLTGTRRSKGKRKIKGQILEPDHSDSDNGDSSEESVPKRARLN